MERRNIKKLGPGNWDSLHISAYHAKTSEEIGHVFWDIKMLSEHLSCAKCQIHFNDNYAKFPPPKHNDNYALFSWTVEMHNKVNALHKKKIFTLAEAIRYYGEEGVCNEDCDEEDVKSPEHKAIVNAIQQSPKVFPKMTLIGGM
jgi:hypothetical protein